jgi:hypothetical protein
MDTQREPSSNHKYSVELRVYGETLVPDSITGDTGLQPSGIRAAGSKRGEKTRRHSMWGYDAGVTNDWESLEAGLSYLLDRLEPHRDVFAKYGESHDVVWWCGHFQRSFDGGPELSASLLQRLAKFGARVYIDNYFTS